MRHFCTVHRWDDAAPCPQCDVAPPTREDVLRRAIVASVSGDVSEVDELFTSDARGSGPATAARSRQDLVAEIQGRRGALVQEEVAFGRAESNGATVRLEWEVSGLHTGALPLPGAGAVLEPTGLRLRVRAVTWARFEGWRIAAWRGHWEDVALAT